MATEKSIQAVLRDIPDPELGVSLWDLGLIYEIEKNSIRQAQGQRVKVVMTLTTMGCPLFAEIAGSIKERIGELDGVEDVEVDLTFDPPWGPEKMSEKAKAELGFM